MNLFPAPLDEGFRIAPSAQIVNESTAQPFHIVAASFPGRHRAPKFVGFVTTESAGHHSERHSLFLKQRNSESSLKYLPYGRIWV